MNELFSLIGSYSLPLVFIHMVLPRRGETGGSAVPNVGHSPKWWQLVLSPIFYLGGWLKFFTLCDPVLVVRHASCVSKQPTLGTKGNSLSMR